jgi:4-hydroxy 2-oxovalerate aldolase
MFDHFTPPPAADPGRLGTLLDVTLRDGGFEVDFAWPTDVLAQVPAALGPVGVDVVELGYLGGVPLEHGIGQPGVGAHLQPSHVDAARTEGLRLAAMVHPTALDTRLDLKAYAAAGLDLLRLVYHPDWAEKIAALASQARDQGLTVSVNIALASRYSRPELVQHAEQILAAMAPDVLYIADTCGALLPSQVSDLVSDLCALSYTEIGFHAHDFLTLAYANALAAAAAGATWLDVSLLGLGRGGGNLIAELVLARHRLPGLQSTEVFGPLLEARSVLASLARRPEPALLPTVCGALNLTPVEEQALVAFADGEGIAVDLAALWLASSRSRVSSLQPEALRAAWQHETEGASR